MVIEPEVSKYHDKWIRKHVRMEAKRQAAIENSATLKILRSAFKVLPNLDGKERAVVGPALRAHGTVVSTPQEWAKWIA